MAQVNDNHELDRMLAFADTFRRHFPRSDQARWLGLYLWGLVATSGRKSIEQMARFLPTALEGAAPSQSLHHFISRSPWDESLLLSDLRKRWSALGEPGATWIIHDVVFLKRGGQSVGVHRQFVRSLRIKANCQTGVMLSQSGPSGYLPLAIRLYLPRHWLDHSSDILRSGIPETYRAPLPKDAIAEQLLESLIAEGYRPSTLTAGHSYATSDLLAEAARRHELNWSVDEETIQSADLGCQWLKDHLGLDHFEGRSWRGWHHHSAAVLVAYGYVREHLPHLLTNR